MPIQLSLFATTTLAASSGPEERNRLGSSDVLAESDEAEPEGEESDDRGGKRERDLRIEQEVDLEKDGGEAADIASAELFRLRSR